MVDSKVKSCADELRTAYARLAAIANSPPMEVAEGEGCPRLAAANNLLAGEAGARPMREGRLQRARLAWSEHVEKGRKLNQSDALALCWAPEVAIRPDFCEVIARSGPLRSRSLRGLMTSYHETWSPSTDGLAQILGDGLRRANRVRGVVESWISNVNELVGCDAPSHFAAGCLGSRSSVSNRLSALSLSLTSPFARGAAEQLAGKVVGRGGDVGLFEYAIEKVFPEDNELLGPSVWGKAFDSLVDDRQRTADDGTRQVLIDLALKTRRLPDPRLRQEKWVNVRKATRERIVQWLSKEDLQFFFKLLMEGQRDPQGRYKFWINYAGRALRSRVVVGSIDQNRKGRQLREISSRGRTYAKMVGSGGSNAHVSAFIMDFGDVTIVEFSKVNSACYIYENDPDDLYLDLSNEEFAWRDLKNTSVARYHSHSVGWQMKFKNILAGYGIRPE